MSGYYPLFEAYPKLAYRFPRIELGEWPTPIDSVGALTNELGVASFHLKRDDISAERYGGNKVRKLELLLADAKRKGKKEVITFGFAGSNHAVATAVYAQQAGIGAISMLLPQENAKSVQRNLLAGFNAGAELNTRASVNALTIASAGKMVSRLLSRGSMPYMISAGGSSPLGVIGFVNAGFELAAQIEAGEMPAPDIIYLPVGSMGSLVGLAIGLRTCGVQSHIEGIRVVTPQFADEDLVGDLYARTMDTLQAADRSFPEVDALDKDWTLRIEFFGEEYGRFTDEGVAAAKRIEEATGIRLDGTYGAKTCAAIFADAADGKLDGKNVLFWLTYNSRDMTPLLGTTDYHELPKPFHHYFETETQPLDRA